MYMYNISVHVPTCTVHVVLQSNQYCSDINWKNLLATEAADRASKITLKVRVHL